MKGIVAGIEDQALYVLQRYGPRFSVRCCIRVEKRPEGIIVVYHA